jgi:hypothetical protein
MSAKMSLHNDTMMYYKIFLMYEFIFKKFGEKFPDKLSNMLKDYLSNRLVNSKLGKEIPDVYWDYIVKTGQSTEVYKYISDSMKNMISLKVRATL